MREVTLPAIERGLARSGRSRADFEISYPGFVVTGHSEESLAASRQAVSKQIAFYGSTPAYAPVLGTHGWGDLQPELNKLSKQGEWDQMGTLITDEILDAFAVVGEPQTIVPSFVERYGDMVDRTMMTVPAKDDDEARTMLATLRAG